MGKTLLRNLPKVDEILENKKIKEILKNYSRNVVIKMTRKIIDEHRENILNGNIKDNIDINILIDEIIKSVEGYMNYSLKRVINGTGIIIHTNLGRSILNDYVNKHIIEINSGYSNLEYDVKEGKRGLRYSHIEEIIMDLTGAEGALVVNNNAAAVMLSLNTVAYGKEVIVSRGELVEIGGSFRIPDVMKISGGTLVEVGTTNKTHKKDFENNINKNTGAILKVHTSNYKIVGFTKETDIDELVNLGKENKIPVVMDLGSGTLVDLSKYGLSKEPTVKEQVDKNIDIITFSGDKLLGGPQAGIIVGKKKYIDKIKKNQLTRALRVDKMTISALEATLKYYLDEEKAVKYVPTLKMITESYKSVSDRADKFKKYFNDNIDIILQDCDSQVGGGTFPLDTISSKAISILPKNISCNKLSDELRLVDIPIICRILNNRIILDVRTIDNSDFEYIAKQINDLLRS